MICGIVSIFNLSTHNKKPDLPEYVLKIVVFLFTSAFLILKLNTCNFEEGELLKKQRRRRRGARAWAR
jgi:hypothetical protein